MKVTWFEFKDHNKELHIGVKPYKNGCCCQQCQRRCPIIRQAEESRSWSDVTVLGLKIVFWYPPKVIDCETHGKAQEAIPWAAAAILKMPTSTLSDLLHRVITRVRKGHKIRGLVTLGVDEISYLRGTDKG